MESWKSWKSPGFFVSKRVGTLIYSLHSVSRLVVHEYIAQSSTDYSCKCTLCMCVRVKVNSLWILINLLIVFSQYAVLLVDVTSMHGRCSSFFNPACKKTAAPVTKILLFGPKLTWIRLTLVEQAGWVKQNTRWLNKKNKWWWWWWSWYWW